ncbi:MAG: hypothetical protein V3T17_11790 [Pseudomonadales bacterium]
MGLIDPYGTDEAPLNHLYNYVDQDPINYFDPEGLAKKKYTKKPNPNKKPAPEHRKPSGERERNVRPERGKGEEHSRRLKGGFSPRMPLLVLPFDPAPIVLPPDPVDPNIPLDC